MPRFDAVGSYLFWVPWLGLILVISPIVVIALGWKIFPTKRWLWLMLPLTLLSVVMVAAPALLGDVLVLLDLAAVALVFSDFLTIIGRTNLRVERRMLRSASLGGSHEITLSVENRSDRGYALEVRDDLPEGVIAEPDVHALSLGGRKRAELRYQLRPQRRGVFRFEKVYFQLSSRFGFWHRFTQRECPGELLVYPNMQQLSEYALLAKTNRLSLIGVRRTRKAGQDDNYKHIDWRATARRSRLTVKQFQQDQSQRIVFLLDSGRLMTNEYQGLSLLDYAMNSILMLSYVALHQGDSVGLMCFSDHVEKYVPLKGGPNQMNRILHGLFDRFPNMKQSNYDEAFLYFSRHCRRRTMVVLITNVIDDVTASQVTGYLSTLSRRHLPVLVLLRDRRVFEAADNPALDESTLYRSAAAAQLLLWRSDVLRKVSDCGGLVIDAFPDQLTAPLVNQYLEVKAKHLL
jgi:uncharacterized protein (DUF58 family)